MAKMSSGPIDLAFGQRDQGDEDGACPSPSSTLPSSAFFSWSVSHVMEESWS
jgi:hypothetical protein